MWKNSAFTVSDSGELIELFIQKFMYGTCTFILIKAISTKKSQVRKLQSNSMICRFSHLLYALTENLLVKKNLSNILDNIPFLRN